MVTEAKKKHGLRSDLALQKSEERFRLVVESAPNAIVMIGPTGLIEMVNAQTEQMFGYTRNELLGKSIEILVPERYRAEHPGLRKSFFADPVSRPAKHEPDSVLVSIQDSGIGIDPENVGCIFEAFFTTKSDGMGMGLAICRSIIEAHNGRIWASSDGRHGAVFNVLLPASEPGLE